MTEEKKATKKKKYTFHQRRGLAQFDINEIQVAQSGVNPFFNSKYSTLDDLHKSIQAPLKKHGIYYTFKMCNYAETGRNILKLQIWDMIGKENDTEEFEESCFLLHDHEDMMKAGSEITYASRYLLSSAFLLSVPAFLDNDGAIPSNESPKVSENKSAPAPAPAPAPASASKKYATRGDANYRYNFNEYWFEGEIVSKDGKKTSLAYLDKYQDLCIQYQISKEQLIERLKTKYLTGRGTAPTKLTDLHFFSREVKEKLEADIITGFMGVSTSIKDADLVDNNLQGDLLDDDIPF